MTYLGSVSAFENSGSKVKVTVKPNVSKDVVLESGSHSRKEFLASNRLIGAMLSILRKLVSQKINIKT